MMSSFSAPTIKFIDCNFASDPKIPQSEAKPDMKLTDPDDTKKVVESTANTSLPTIEQKTEFSSSAKKITHDAHGDINSGSESEFPELPPFKEMFLSPITPKKQPQYPHSRLTTDFPPTPDTTPARRLKRYTSPLDSPSRSGSFKQAIQKASSKSLVSRTPPFSKFHKLKPKPADSISALEFDRMAEAVMQQIDWKAVSEHVASNRSEGVFKRIIATILKEQEAMLKKSEKEQSALLAFELGR